MKRLSFTSNDLQRKPSDALDALESGSGICIVLPQKNRIQVHFLIDPIHDAAGMRLAPPGECASTSARAWPRISSNPVRGRPSKHA